MLRLFSQNCSVLLPSVQCPQTQALALHRVVFTKVASVCHDYVPFPLLHRIFQMFLRLSRSGTANFHSRPLHFSSNWYFYPSFKICISDQPSPSSLLVCHVSHITTGTHKPLLIQWPQPASSRDLNLLGFTPL